MHYQINDILIESELAAKPISQTNKEIVSYVSKLPCEYSVLDYGCGKLRYSLLLAKQCNRVVAIDSADQIMKIQMIGGQYILPASVNVENLFVMDVCNTEWKEEKYDLVFCTNVLSAIPFESVRLELLMNAKRVLKPSGYLFLSIQYRNSYFSNYSKRNDVEKYNDGWLIRRDNKKGAFYGVLQPDYLVELCKQAGFSSFSIKKKDGSCYIEAR